MPFMAPKNLYHLHEFAIQLAEFPLTPAFSLQLRPLACWNSHAKRLGDISSISEPQNTEQKRQKFQYGSLKV